MWAVVKCDQAGTVILVDIDLGWGQLPRLAISFAFKQSHFYTPGYYTSGDLNHQWVVDCYVTMGDYTSSFNTHNP
jgi:hypothetical protein